MRGAGEGAPLVSEERRLGQGRRDGRAIHHHKRTAAPEAPAMERAGDQFLAGARLSQHKHAQFRGGSPTDALEHQMHRRARAEHAIDGFGFVEANSLGSIRFENELHAPEKNATR